MLPANPLGTLLMAPKEREGDSVWRLSPQLPMDGCDPCPHSYPRLPASHTRFLGHIANVMSHGHLKLDSVLIY